jgi:hypothetical protein
MIIGIHFVQDYINRGPQKVVHNLMLGLAKIRQDFVSNRKGDFNICLQYFPGILNFDPVKTLIGPNVGTIPPTLYEVAPTLNRYSNFLVPCEWVKKSLFSFQEFNNKNIYIWPVGIDTDMFNISKINNLDCFIYYKNRSVSELDTVKNFLNSKKLKYRIITYGSYSEDQLKDVCKMCRFCVVLGNTESQGIAIMEILSMNTPCYVIDCSVCDYNWAGIYKFPATSAPYFNDTCGVIGDLSFKDFDQFISNIDSYKPRDFIIKEHTLEISTNNLMKIINSI